MKKSTKQFLALLLVLVICVGAYFGIVMHKAAVAQRQAEEEAANTLYIGTLEDVAHITYFNGTETLSFYKDGYLWYYEEDAEFPLNSSPIRSIASAAVGLTAVKELPLTEDASAYGLGDTAKWVEMTSSSGETLKLLVGNYVNYNYYAMEPDGDVIYQIDYKIPENLDYTLTDLMELESFDALEEAVVKSMTFTIGDNVVSVETETYEADDTVEVLDPATGELKTEHVTAGTYWYVVVNGAKYKAVEFQPPTPDPEMEGVNSPALIYYSYLLEYLSAFSFDANYAYKPTDDILADCGLANPDMTIDFEYQLLNTSDELVDNHYVLYVGGTLENESGVFRYVRFAGSDQLNLMDASLLTPIYEVVAKFLPADNGDAAE